MSEIKHKSEKEYYKNLSKKLKNKKDKISHSVLSYYITELQKKNSGYSSLLDECITEIEKLVKLNMEQRKEISRRGNIIKRLNNALEKNR